MQQPEEELDYTIAISYLGRRRRYLKQWVKWYQAQVETSITVRDPRDILTQLYNVDQAYRRLMIETGRLN